MSWASKRRSIYVSGVIIVAIAIIAPIIFSVFFNKEPTCFDERQNGDEKGIDCGGSCEKLCSLETLNPTIVWSRSFEVSEGVYNAIAYIKNPNSNGGILKIPYTFKLFDDKNLLIAERKGSTFIAPNTVAPIFERAISTGERKPIKTFFEFNGKFIWSRIDEYQGNDLKISEIRLSNIESSPRVDAVLSNTSIIDIKNIEAVVIVFDFNDNAIAVSSTFIEKLSNRSSRNIVFTWPNKFSSKPTRVEIIHKISFEN